jgi:hypothetical protein
MASDWPALPFEQWRATCDTLHAHTQVLGKFAVALGYPEPQLQHAALRLTARGWETPPLPAPDGNGSLVIALDLHAHEAVVERSAQPGTHRVGLVGASVGAVARELLEVTGAQIDPTPQEVAWTVPLDQDEEHTTYEPAQVATYFAAATRVALALAAYRAPYRGRATPVNAWWGSFDLAVNLYSGHEAEPPSDDFIMRNAMDSMEVAVGWWPGDERYPKAAFYGYAHPARPGFDMAQLDGGGWNAELGEYVLDWDELIAQPDPHAFAVRWCREVFRHACLVCDWDPALAATAHGTPPPVR